jgi:hypothetical protein
MTEGRSLTRSFNPLFHFPNLERLPRPDIISVTAQSAKHALLSALDLRERGATEPLRIDQQALGVLIGLALKLPLGAQPMVKLTPVRMAFIHPDQVGALPDLVVFGSIVSRNGGENIRIRTPARFSRWLVGH